MPSCLQKSKMADGITLAVNWARYYPITMVPCPTAGTPCASHTSACYDCSFTLSLVCDCHTAHPVFMRLFGLHHTTQPHPVSTRLVVPCHTTVASATDTQHTFGLLTFAINSLCITHLHQFPRFKCTMQCQMAVQPWTTAESSAVHPEFDAISDGDLPWKVVDFSAAHPLLQCNTNGVQPRKAAEPSAVHQQPNSMQNTGSQPWMTAEPLLCTQQIKWFVRSCTMPMWPSEATLLGPSTSWRLRYAPT